MPWNACVWFHTSMAAFAPAAAPGAPPPAPSVRIDSMDAVHVTATFTDVSAPCLASIAEAALEDVLCLGVHGALISRAPLGVPDDLIMGQLAGVALRAPLAARAMREPLPEALAPPTPMDTWVGRLDVVAGARVRSVTAGDIAWLRGREWAGPEADEPDMPAPAPVLPDTVLLRLLPGQALRVEVHATLGRGRWGPPWRACVDARFRRRAHVQWKRGAVATLSPDATRALRDAQVTPGDPTPWCSAALTEMLAASADAPAEGPRDAVADALAAAIASYAEPERGTGELTLVTNGSMHPLAVLAAALAAVVADTQALRGAAGNATGGMLGGIPGGM